MSRVIKFRAWDVKDKKMIHSEDGLTWYLNTKGTLFFGDTLTRQGGPSVSNYACECELMQFTGLQDKNGVDIYEGDILKDNHLNRIGKVFYHDSYCQFKFNFGISNSVINSYVEVVGNIHENSELLGE
jgi:uncharacterized phage protein (TIGR01671 family)